MKIKDFHKFLCLTFLFIGTILVILMDLMPYILLKFFHFNMYGNIILIFIIKYTVGLPLIVYSCYLMTKYTE